ncbi:MAG TPA: carboxypeptidase-like regulatory domain-containing protein [Candidatus Acidoferrum sp.]
MKSVLKSGSFVRLLLSYVLIFGLIVSLLVVPSAKADNLYASIRGTVTDPTGAVVPGVTLTAINRATGVSYSTTSQADGAYAFLQLQIGDYDVTAQKQGFTKFLLSKLHLDVNQVYALDVKMEVGQLSETVTVEASAVQVNTSSPQLGGVVDANAIVNMPLIGRNWINLQQTQPGVVGASDGRGGFATNGSQSQQNSFLVNGTDTNDIALNTPLIIPSPDAIAEFRMVTGTINPEYGRNSGATINALVKSGTNSFHGDVFEFYRDPFLNAKNFFAPAAVFHQNQFGGTIGGPIWKRHIFGFFSYQGTRARQPQNVATDVPVFATTQLDPTNLNAGANFPDIATSSTKSPIQLVGSDGNTYAAGTAYSTVFGCAGGTTPGCVPGFIPSTDINSVSGNLIKTFVPKPNVVPPPGQPASDFQFNPITTLTADQYLFRIDDNLTSKDTLWGTWFQQKSPSVSTIPFTGATLPGFASTNQTHLKMVTLSWTHVINDHMLNELRGGYTRLNFKAVFPVKPVQPSSFGFAINPQSTSGAGVPVINVLGLFSLGFSSNGPQPRVDQTYQATDNFSLTKGHHTMKIGFDMRRFQVDSQFFFGNEGTYTFNGGGAFSTGDPGADFVLGIPDGFGQGSGGLLSVRSQQYYSYIQDEYKLRPNFTLTFGSGWTVDTPMVDKSYQNHAMVAFAPGQQSIVFPNAPVGYVFNGDPGVHPSGTLHAFKYFGPRFGFAYSPGWGGWLTGGPGKTSIRGGYGIYYNRYEEELTLQYLGMPPFTVSSAGAGSLTFAGGAAGSPSFANPYVDIAGRGSINNPFPFNGVVPQNVQFTAAAGYLPLWQACCGTVDPATVDPTAENFNLTLERQLSSSMKMSLGYVGAVAHHLSVGTPVNIPTPLSKLAADCAAAPGTCDSFGGATSAFPNDYLVDPNIYGPIDQISSRGNSNYNSFQATLERRLSRGLQFGASYTYAHSLDDGSGFENTSFGGGGFGGLSSVRAANPYCLHCNYASSIFDVRHRLVLNVYYQIPNVSHNPLLSRLTGGWAVATLPTFATGFPLDVVETQLRSFVCQANFSDFACPDVPNLVGPIKTYNPRTTITASGHNLWFSGKGAPDPNSFAFETPGTIGNAPRNLFRGPGRNNWDFQLSKDTHINESMYFQLRIEMYNVFNHTQFNPSGISTNLASSRFGQVRSAFDPRQIQLAAKFYF